MKSVTGSAVFEAYMETVCPTYPLYPYQRQVLCDILKIVASGRDRVVLPDRRVVAHLPTGAGKTRIACHVAAHLLNEAESEGKLVVWLASTEELCEQASEDLAVAWSHLGNRQVTISRYWGAASHSLNNLSEGFLVASLAKLWAVGSRRPGLLTQLARSVAAVVFDEAHQAVARTYRFITEQLVTYNPPLLGLTATPGRTSGIRAQDYDLAEMFNHNKVSIDPRGHGSPVTYLIRQEYIAEPEFIRVAVDANVDSLVTRAFRVGSAA